MNRETLEARMGTLKAELEKANEELGKLRPRVQYLEAVMMRVDGALTVLQELLDAPGAPPAIPPGADSKPRSDAEFAPSWQTVAP